MDISKVSGAVQGKVEKIINSEDGAENITKKEYEALGDYLNGLKGTEERAYVQQYMNDYEDGTKNNAISDGAKELVKKAKALLGKDPNAIDSETEATALNEALNDPSWGEEDKAYFERELTKYKKEQNGGKNIPFGINQKPDEFNDKMNPRIGIHELTPENLEKLIKKAKEQNVNSDEIRSMIGMLPMTESLKELTPENLEKLIKKAKEPNVNPDEIRSMIGEMLPMTGNEASRKIVSLLQKHKMIDKPSD